MFLETVDQFATVAVGKAAFLRRSPLGFWISSMMAGAYVELGIILIFCVGANVDPSIRPVVMCILWHRADPGHLRRLGLVHRPYDVHDPGVAASADEPARPRRLLAGF